MELVRNDLQGHSRSWAISYFVERIRGAFCDDALYKSTFTFTFRSLELSIRDRKVGYSYFSEKVAE